MEKVQALQHVEDAFVARLAPEQQVPYLRAEVEPPGVCDKQADAAEQVDAVVIHERRQVVERDAFREGEHVQGTSREYRVVYGRNLDEGPTRIRHPRAICTTLDERFPARVHELCRRRRGK